MNGNNYKFKHSKSTEYFFEGVTNELVLLPY